MLNCKFQRFKLRIIQHGQEIKYTYLDHSVFTDMRLSGLTSSCLMADSRSRMASRSTSCSICRKSAVLEDLQHRQGGHTEVNTDRWSYRGQHRQVVRQRSKQTGGHAEVNTDRWSYMGYNTDRIPYKGGIMLVTVALHYRWEHKIFLK